MECAKPRLNLLYTECLCLLKIHMLKLGFARHWTCWRLYLVFLSLQLLLLLLSHFSCVGLCNPIDGHPPGSPVPGILQARTLEWVAISFSNAWNWKVKLKSLSRVRPSATPWTAAYQAPPSMGFSRQVYWSGLPLPFPLSLQKVWEINFLLFINFL